MKKVLTALVLIISMTSLTACSNMNNQDVGTVSGGVIGGLLGSQFGKGGGQLLAVGTGALLGAYMGGAIGKNMDENDQLCMTRALENNSVGQPAYWQNEKSGNTYTVVPKKNVTVSGNRYCREYQTTATIAGKQQQMYGTACRQPDGSWKLVK